MPGGILEKIKSVLERDRAVRLVAEDPILTSELLLLFRMILADGQVRGAELDAYKRICMESFGLDPKAMDSVYEYLQDFAYETTSEQAIAMFKALPVERRQALLDHMIAIAEADDELNAKEMRLLEKTADMLGFDVKNGV